MAGVPLAATTYYYADKGAILLAASDQLLDRVTKDVTGRPGLAARPLANRIILALAAKPALFCAWAELMLYSARGSEGYRIGTQWYSALDQMVAGSILECPEIDRPHLALSVVDIVVGVLFATVSQDPGAKATEQVLNERADPRTLWKPADISVKAARNARRTTRKSTETRCRILNGAIELLYEDGPGAVTYRAVAERSGVARGTPFYQYNTASELLSEAQRHLFQESKARYRNAVQPSQKPAESTDQLIERTASIFWREATQHKGSSISSYSLWIESAREPALRPMIWNAIEDQLLAWRKVLSTLAGNIRPIDPLLAQGLFVGKLIRVLSTGSREPDRSVAELAFRRDLSAIIQGTFWI
ncbi:TetR family transcriptional regulator [Hyphomonas oceanitis SCH89]|uniref:TetR family transcriptional regulator n=1 Tax=Hyphomonas oceanitis SCH89 TaxID=1280953 RepID=A0A059G2H6_9PROT|nr:TetR family transcriptional regulator [Hyphomonas oceanitis SCH89]